MPITIKEQTFNTGTISLNYVEVPAFAPPLVLLHGGTSRWQNFEVIMPELAADWHLYALDLRGHGQSGRMPGHYRLQDYADDIIVFLREVVGETAVIVGHSMGGMVALLVAAQYPEMVRATLAEIAAAIPGMPPIHVYQTDPDMFTALLDDFEKTAVGYEMESVLPAIQCPVLLLQADPATGGVMTDTEVARAMTLLPNATHLFLPGLSHVLHNEQKEPVLRALFAFLETA